MNGELTQICQIVISTKNAWKGKRKFVYEKESYVQHIEFRFLSQQRKWFAKKAPVAYQVSDWFKICQKKGLSDIKMLLPFMVENRNLLGFANTTQSSILCFYPKGIVTCFVASWDYDENKKGWNVIYQEHEWENPPQQKPTFEDPTIALQAILLETADFAHTIGMDYYKNRFLKARQVLLGEIKCDQKEYLADIPKPYQNLYAAACYADVFGAMDSWNDSPPYLAHEKGLDEDYEKLSAELLKQVRLAVLYAVNECKPNEVEADPTKSHRTINDLKENVLKRKVLPYENLKTLIESFNYGTTTPMISLIKTLKFMLQETQNGKLISYLDENNEMKQINPDNFEAFVKAYFDDFVYEEVMSKGKRLYE